MKVGVGIKGRAIVNGDLHLPYVAALHLDWAGHMVSRAVQACVIFGRGSAGLVVIVKNMSMGV